MDDLKGKIKSFPASPGVYLMKDEGHHIIYVGKARHLRSRVLQYFSGKDTRYQIGFLMKRVTSIEFLQTQNEKEALLLENSLIKKHQPRYNLFLRDDKTYQCLKITAKDKFPRLLTTRRVKKDGAVYYGPFTNAQSLYAVKEFIDRYFQLRTCSDREFANRTRPCLEYQIKRCSAPCVNYVSPSDYAKQIQTVRLFLEGRNRDLQREIEAKMQNAAQHENFEGAARLRDLLKNMHSVLEQQHVSQLIFDFVDIIALKREKERVGIAVLMVREGQLIDSKYHVFKAFEDDEEVLQNFMTQYYSETAFIPNEIFLPFELKEKELLASLLCERSGKRVILRAPIKGERKNLLKLAEQNLNSHFLQHEKREMDIQAIMESLQENLNLDRLPVRIECYDVSNLSGKYAAASMVSFVGGEKFSAGYRRFKIHLKETPDDYAMMREVLMRRCRRQDTGWQLPDLLLIDGGKGQVGIALSALKELNVTGVAVAGVAKGKGEGVRAKGIWAGKKCEEIYVPGRKTPILFKADSPELLLIQRIRDEAHRFAISYHRKLRDEGITRSLLDDIFGIGPKIKKNLMRTFGSVNVVMAASDQDLLKVSGVTCAIVQRIRASTKILPKD